MNTSGRNIRSDQVINICQYSYHRFFKYASCNFSANEIIIYDKIDIIFLFEVMIYPLQIKANLFIKTRNCKSDISFTLILLILFFGGACKSFVDFVLQIVEGGILPLLIRMLQYDDVREQSSAARILWTLLFDETVREKFVKDEQELATLLENLKDSKDKSVSSNARGALWFITGANQVTELDSE